MSYSCPPKAFVQETNDFFLHLPFLFNASDNPRDENTIKVGAKRHIANIFKTKDVVTLEKNEALNQYANCTSNCQKPYVQVVVLLAENMPMIPEMP